MKMGRRVHARVDQRIQTLDGELCAPESKQRSRGNKEPEDRNELIPLHIEQ